MAAGCRCFQKPMGRHMVGCTGCRYELVRRQYTISGVFHFYQGRWSDHREAPSSAGPSGKHRQSDRHRKSRRGHAHNNSCKRGKASIFHIWPLKKYNRNTSSTTQIRVLSSWNSLQMTTRVKWKKLGNILISVSQKPENAVNTTISSSKTAVRSKSY